MTRGTRVCALTHAGSFVRNEASSPFFEFLKELAPTALSWPRADGLAPPRPTLAPDMADDERGSRVVAGLDRLDDRFDFIRNTSMFHVWTIRGLDDRAGRRRSTAAARLTLPELMMRPPPTERSSGQCICPTQMRSGKLKSRKGAD